MSIYAPEAFVNTYSTNIMMLLQQQDSRFRKAVNERALKGKAASVAEQFGKVTAVRNIGRHSDTPLISTPQNKRWVAPNSYTWADLFDMDDEFKMLIDPTGPMAQAGSMSMARAMDDEIIRGLFLSNATGEDGLVSTGPLSTYSGGSQVVAADVGSNGATGLNIAKLRAAKKLLMAAEVDIDREMLFVGITAQQHDDLLNETQAINLDYNTTATLVNGRITSFMGFNFIPSERIPGGPGYEGNIDTSGQYWVPFWAQSGVVLGIWNDIYTSVTRRHDKNDAWQVLVKGMYGATRTEEKRVGFIRCI